VLDIGGGFPVPYGSPTLPIASSAGHPPRARDAAARLRVIAEPGRYIVGPAGPVSRPSWDGAARGPLVVLPRRRLYGSFSGQLYDHALYPIDCLRRRGPRYPSVLAGPTCDSIDVVREDIPLPELDIGDLVVGRMMGAYTAATATDFNFIPAHGSWRSTSERERTCTS